MKQLAKKLLPNSIVRHAKAIRERFNYRDKPRLTRSPGNSGGVLQCCIAYNTYGGYCVPLASRHRLVAQTILAGKIWEPETIEFVTAHCGDGDIVDAGTFFGDFLPAFSQACAPGAKVWAFEPNPENYRCTLITTYINGLDIELTNAGLGERQGSLPLLIADASGRARGGASQIVEKNYGRSEGTVITVEIVTVDEMVPSDRQVSVIHLDVEGFEKQALSGALGTIQRCRPIIILETLPEESWLAENLLQLGYQVAGSVHGNIILRNG